MINRPLENVVESLNNNKVISKMDCSANSLKYKFEQDLKDAVKYYKTKMDAELNTEIPLDREKFKDKAKSVAGISKKAFKLGLNHILEQNHQKPQKLQNLKIGLFLFILSIFQNRKTLKVVE
jgi:hypothetical protein